MYPLCWSLCYIFLNTLYDHSALSLYNPVFRMVLKSDEYLASKLVNPQKSVQTFYVPSRSNVLLLENWNGGIKAFLSLMWLGHSRGNSPGIHNAAPIGSLQLIMHQAYCQWERKIALVSNTCVVWLLADLGNRYGLKEDIIAMVGINLERKNFCEGFSIFRANIILDLFFLCTWSTSFKWDERGA